jgi:hypothetical protein
MTAETNNLRSLRSSIAANCLWSNVEDRTAHTEPARRAFEKRFEDQVDPHRTLTPEERAKRAANARQAHFQRMALLSAKSRARKSRARKARARKAGAR